MPFFKHLYIMFTLLFTSPSPPKKDFLYMDSLSVCKKFTNTDSNWQIIQMRKKNGRGLGGDVCGLGECVGWLVIFFTKIQFF